MSLSRKWRYFAGYCYYKTTKQAGIFSGPEEGHWVLKLDREYLLADGLNHMGDLGYELVGIHPAELRNGGSTFGWYYPPSIYIFKQPVDT